MSENKKRNKDLENLKDTIKKILERALIEKSESKKNLEGVLKDKNKFLKIFNPWHKDNKGRKLIENFVKQINNHDFTDDFSWLDILNEDAGWKKFQHKIKNEIKEDKTKYVNMRYQIPTHFHGDIDKAIVFHCMENPRGYVEDSDMNKWAKEVKLGKTTLKDYYQETSKRREEMNQNENIQEIIKERYKLEEINKEVNKSYTNAITNIIYSDENNPLICELKNMFGDNEFNYDDKYKFKNDDRINKTLLPYYYMAQYYSKLLQIDKGDLSKFKNEDERKHALEIAEKICNLEIYPFSCNEPALGKNGVGEKILLNSDLSRVGAYIVLRRIYIYLDSKADTLQPVFIFRKYDRAWEKLFKKIFHEAEDKKFTTEKIMEQLETHFFYCQPASSGGGITPGNIISVSDFNNLQKIYTSLKEKAFKNIFDLLHESQNKSLGN